ncbi:hypothetical protein LSH36_90g07075, partial [Paralvinella palmiformis]
MSYSALLCWASLKLSTESYLQHFAKKFCPSTYHTSEKTVSSFPDEHGRLSLVAKLWRDEHESMKILLAAGNICKQSESLSETRTSMEFLPASCVAIQSSQKTCHYSEEKKMSCDKKQHVICELKILRLINPLVTGQNSSGFCFIRCNLKEINQTVTQLLVLPPNVNRFRDKRHNITEDGHQKDVINFNIIIVENISRNRFWNELPKTTEKLRVIQTSELKVLDFEMVQSLDNSQFLDHLIGGSSSPGETVFKAATLAGYQTLWVEDVCGHWKIKMNISNIVSWMSEACVLDLGPSFAFCEARKWNREDQPCFNGVSWLDYSLKYMHYYQHILAKFRQPHISVFHSHMGNDLLTMRSADELLARYVEFSASQKNTLTVIISYPSSGSPGYPNYVLNGAPILFHPVMFVIMPNSVQWSPSDPSAFMSNLIANQNRLVTTLDLYESLKYMMHVGHSNPEHPRFSEQLGLLGNIPLNRSCNDILMSSVGTCICEGFRVPIKNRKYVTILAEYAVSELNAKLQREFDVGVQHLREAGYTDHVVSTCRRLVGKSTSDVMQSLIQ